MQKDCTIQAIFLKQKRSCATKKSEVPLKNLECHAWFKHMFS